MANNPSALKRVKQSEKRRTRNRSYKSSINTSVKKSFAQLDEKNTENASALFKSAIAKIDSAVNKGIFHRNEASRKISKLTKKFNVNSASS